MADDNSDCTPSALKRNRTEGQPREAAIGSPLNRKTPTIHRLAVTGGPCAGKSTFLALVKNTVEERTGVKVFCVPEAATLLVTGGLQWTSDSEATIEFQLALLRTQIALEDAFTQVAAATRQPALIVCDRGVMDGRAYCTPEQYEEVLKRGDFSLERLRDQRYDAVLHLVSAAIGAESFYNMDNPARFESLEGAKTADLHLRNMYIGHPRVKLVDNSSESFQVKMDRAIDFVFELIGHKLPKHRNRRYLVERPPDLNSIPVPTATLDIVITILSGSTPTNVKFLLKRETADTATYFFYNPMCDSNEERVQSQHMLSAREYANLILQRAPEHEDVVKRGVSFTYGGYFYELAIFQEPQWMRSKGIVYVSCDDDSVDMPPWLTVDRDTTGQAEYSSFEISKKRSA